MEDENKFPVEISIEDSGIFYGEAGPNKAYIALVISGYTAEDLEVLNKLIEKTRMRLVMIIGDGGLDTQFAAMSYGKILFMTAVSDGLAISAKMRSDNTFQI